MTFQVEEAVGVGVTEVSSNQSGFQLMEESGSDERKKVLELAEYMRERYLREESEGYCQFEDQPEVLENIVDKYENLEENLDEIDCDELSFKNYKALCRFPI